MEEKGGKALFTGLISNKLNKGTLCTQLSHKEIGQPNTRVRPHPSEMGQPG